ncbi:hypothetical protein ONZ51_g2853 [Trametes cubensis]|uniref:Vesicle transport protein USE1 n=1 Tax=Trametes cubensis TaxID=1111947 RepID=A0AAD7XE28_9APHY|nr:hypothetical protein ONZ51_g2853 [Trametes cubensis]
MEWCRGSAIFYPTKVRHARKLLHSVETNEDAGDSVASQRYDEFRRTLDRLERIVAEADKRVALTPKKPEPILSSIPPPSLVSEVGTAQALVAIEDPSDTLLPVEPTPSSATHGLLLTPSDSAVFTRGPINPSESLLPPSMPSTETSATQAAPAFLQNSAALHEELSAQLAHMATQLKRNAVHFADALEKDKAVVLETQEKLERNHDVMSKERVRLRDHRSKSWGTTWITILSIVVVLIGFLLTFFVIRIT